jgi:hypothetical protein
VHSYNEHTFILRQNMAVHADDIVMPEGDAFKLGDPRLNTIDWLVEGIQTNL